MRKDSLIILTFEFILMLVASCNLRDVSRQLDTSAPVVYKHKTCDLCHNSSHPIKGGPLFAPGVDPSSHCLSDACHRSYSSNHHPVDFVPAPSELVSPGGELPLFEGWIRCLTCHDPHAGPEYTETPRLLRGGYPADVPYKDRRRLCFKCHLKDKYSDIYPHLMLDENGKLIQVNGKPVCLLCHVVVPDPEKHRRSDVRFRADIAFLCWRCHPPMPGEFFEKHFLVRPSERVRDDIDRNEKRMNVIFPLIPRERITCATCHNPHQKEVMRDPRARAGADEPKRLRLPSPAICLGCHATK